MLQDADLQPRKGGGRRKILKLAGVFQSLYFLFYGGRAHIYNGVSFCYNLGPRASPKYKVAACRRVSALCACVFADKRNTSGYNVHLAYHPSCSSQTCAWGKKQRTRRPSTCQRSRAVQGRKTPPLNWVPLNQDDPAVRNKCFGLHSEPHSRKRTSQMQTASTAAPTSYIDLYRQGMPSCTVPLYCIQPLYSHYTATIQPDEVMSEAWGLYVWEPQRRAAR